jgi:predicted N-acetyltransferase YhbS
LWPLFTPLPEDTELVAFGGCQYHPRLITLADVNTPSAMSKQTSHLGGLVIRPDAAIVGHVLLTAAELVDGCEARHRVLVLSPLSVLPQQQRRGIGAALVREALARADAEGEELVVLQGSPRYYPRFGFRDSRTIGVSMDLPEWAPPEAGMACPLSAYRPATRGRLIESQPFLDLTH